VSDGAAVLEDDVEQIVAGLGPLLGSLDDSDLLLTGGAGFLGYELVHALVHHNRTRGGSIRVTVSDNFSRGRPPWLQSVADEGAVALIEHDVTVPLPADLPPFTWIIHAASIASPTFYRQHPIATMDANVTGLRLLLDDAAARAGGPDAVRGMLFFSTSEIYGDPTPDAIPTPETYRGNVSCTGPRACYDESKRYGETLCVNFAAERGVPVSMARPFNNYGPGLALGDRRVIPDLARDALAGADLVLLSDGSPTRTFCYVSDAVDGYLRILVEGRRGEAYNIGTEAPEISILDLARTIAGVAAEELGYDGQVIHGASEDADYLTDNPNRRCPVIEKARRELGFEPRTALVEGLRRSLRWYAGEAP
jgi:nucleoside-diphosphate-sugar epimerase